MGQETTKSSQKTNSKPSSKKGSGKGKYHCMLHGDNVTHSTENCNQLCKEAKRLKGDGGGSDGKPKNKTWNRKSSSSNKSKEHNTLEALASEVKELKEANKNKRKADGDDDSDGTMSIHAMEEMLEGMDFNSDDEDAKSEGEISV